MNFKDWSHCLVVVPLHDCVLRIPDPTTCTSHIFLVREYCFLAIILAIIIYIVGLKNVWMFSPQDMRRCRWCSLIKWTYRHIRPPPTYIPIFSGWNAYDCVWHTDLFVRVRYTKRKKKVIMWKTKVFYIELF